MKLKILSQAVDVSFCDAKGWDTGSAGQWCDEDNTIKIKDRLSEDVKDLTLCHEITHAIESFTGISLTEEQVQAIGLGWHSVILENWDLIRKLRKWEARY